MTIKVKLKGNKAITRFNNQADESFFIHVVRSARDDLSYPHPAISLKGSDGRELPPRKPEKTVDQIVKDNKAKIVKDVKVMEKDK